MSGGHGGRRNKHEEHEEHQNHEAWIIPYADMLTLLMGLFLVLWSISTIDLEKMKEVGAGFSDAIGAQGGPVLGGGDGEEDTGNGDGLDGAGVPGAPPTSAPSAEEKDATDAYREHREAEIDRIEGQLRERIESAGLGAEVKFRREDRGVVAVISDSVLFAPGQANLQPEGADILGRLAPILADMGKPIMVEGHTDSVPISTVRFPSNWELSTARATTVVRHLMANFGFSPNRISASGYADTRPIGDNATVEGRASNRRVDIVVLADIDGSGSE